MKTRTLSLILAAALGVIAILPLSAASVQPVAYPVSAVECFGGTSIQPGDTMITVLRRLSVPARKLSRHTWVYHNVQPGSRDAAADDCSTLVVTFKAGKVSNLKLANEHAVIAIAANLRVPARPVRMAKN